MRHFYLILAVFILSIGAAQAQMSMNDLASPNRKTSCADMVSVPELMEASDLSFTGRVIKRNDSLTWFRAYVVHHGKPVSNIVKTAGFFASDTSLAGSGQSYQTGGIYTVVLHRPKNKQEKALGVDYINSLDQCEEGIISKIHNRYGNYRVTDDMLEPDFSQKLGNHFFFFKYTYLILLIVGAGAIAGYLNRDKLCAVAGKLQERDMS